MAELPISMDDSKVAPVEAQAVPDQPVATIERDIDGVLEVRWKDQQRFGYDLPIGTELFTRPTPAAADLHQQYVYVRLIRPEGYEDVHPELLVADAHIHPAFEPEIVAASPAAPAPTGRMLPKPGTEEVSKALDAMLAEYDFPANTKNAARAGWEAANRWLASRPTPAAADPADREKLKILASAIAEAAQKAGIYNGEVPLAGPHLLQLLDDLASGPCAASPAAAADLFPIIFAVARIACGQQNPAGMHHVQRLAEAFGDTEQGQALRDMLATRPAPDAPPPARVVAAAAAPSIHALMDAAGYASSQGFLPGTTNWASAMQHALSHPAAPLAGQDFRGSSAQSTSAPSATVPREHIASADCWCQPEVDHVDPATGNTVYVHRSTQ